LACGLLYFKYTNQDGVPKLKKLTEDLKRMLTGLAYQDVGEFLPMNEKLKAFGVGMKPEEATSPNTEKVLQQLPARKRVALISDGFGSEALVDYALHTCQRLGAQLDLLFHGTANTEWKDDVVRQLRRERVSYHRVNLSANAAEEIEEYIHSQLQLLYILAQPNDPAVTELMEEVMLMRGKHLAVPMVLIEHKPGKQFRRVYTG
jgi:hypothetical protein